jgi:hypothetical protein
MAKPDRLFQWHHHAFVINIDFSFLGSKRQA